MEERASGIILRTRPFTETSLIVQWITADLGRISTVARGARRAKSPFAGKLDLFYAADFSFQRSRRSELHTLREIQVRDAHAKLREELAWIHQSSYFAVLLERSTETETPVPELYDLLRSALGALPNFSPGARFVYAFELKLLGLLGYEPKLAELSDEARRVAEELSAGRFETFEKLQLSPRAYMELNRFLRESIGTALDRLPPQREKALEALLPKTTGSS